MSKSIDFLMRKDFEFKKMITMGLISKTIERYKYDDELTKHVKKLEENIDNLCEVDMFENIDTFERLQTICLLKKGADIYDVILDMLSYNVNYIDMYDGGDDFMDNVLEYAIKIKDLDFLENECFKFIIDGSFPNKIYDRIRATLICMGNDINEVDEWYNWITSEEE